MLVCAQSSLVRSGKFEASFHRNCCRHTSYAGSRMSVLSSLYSSFNEGDDFSSQRFVEAAILFDELQFSNTNLLPQLIRAAGIEGTLALLESGILKIVGGGPNAQAKFDFTSPGFFRSKNAIFEPMNFGFETVFVNPNIAENLSVEDRLAENLAATKKVMKISDGQIAQLQESITASMQVLDGQTLETHEIFRNDVSNHQRFLVDVLVKHLAKLGLPVHVLNFSMSIEEVADHVYRVNTDLARLLRRSEVEIHEMVKGPFFEISGTNLQLVRMRQLNAAAGLSERQSEITMSRIDFLSKVHANADQRKDLTRILELTEIPTFDPGTRFSVNELLELRNSDEARAFRDYLRQGGGMDEQEIIEALGSWRQKVGEKIRTPRGSGIRWLASAGLGSILNPLAGAAVSGIDYFLEKLLPDMGPIGFIDSEYRSFVKKQMNHD